VCDAKFSYLLSLTPCPQDVLSTLHEEERNLDQHIQNVQKSMRLLLEDPLHKVPSCISSLVFENRKSFLCENFSTYSLAVLSNAGKFVRRRGGYQKNPTFC
jgi:hypothetical protein